MLYFILLYYYMQNLFWNENELLCKDLERSSEYKNFVFR